MQENSKTFPFSVFQRKSDLLSVQLVVFCNKQGVYLCKVIDIEILCQMGGSTYDM